MSDTPFADMVRDPRQYLMAESARHGLAGSIAIIECENARLRSELEAAQSELKQWREQYPDRR